MEELLKEKTFTKNVENGPQSWEDKQTDTYNPLKTKMIIKRRKGFSGYGEVTINGVKYVPRSSRRYFA